MKATNPERERSRAINRERERPLRIIGPRRDKAVKET